MTARGTESGMTLIEMLVVLAIVGVMAGATVLGIGSATRGPSVEAEAQRLASRLQSAADEAMVSDRPVAFDWDKDGYAFTSWSRTGWQVRDDEALGRHELAGGIRMDMGKSKPPLMVGIDGSGIPAMIGLVGGSGERWTVAYDGLTAIAIASPRT